MSLMSELVVEQGTTKCSDKVVAIGFVEILQTVSKVSVAWGTESVAMIFVYLMVVKRVVRNVHQENI